MFTEAIKKHDDYKRRCFVERGGYSPYDAEAGKKIAQLEWLICKAQFLNKSVMENSRTNINAATDALSELEIVSEAFYYFVGRLVELFKHHPIFKFNFKKLPQSNAEKVRHQLLQHPEKQKEIQKASSSFECGAEEGPKFKSYSGPKGALVDNGLFVNAQEFNNKLVCVFDIETSKAKQEH